MSSTELNLAELLEVGGQAVIATQPNVANGPRHLVTLKGWDEGEYLMFEAPIAQKSSDAGIAGRNRRISVRKKSEVVVRFIREGQVCAFREVVTDSFNLRELPHFTVKWPLAFETIDVRKHPRVRIGAQCTVTCEDGPEVEGQVRDISVGGAAIALEEPLEKEAIIKATITFQDGNQLKDIQSIVRNTRPGDGTTVHGIEFLSPNDDLKQELKVIVKSAMANEKKSKEEPVTIIALTAKDAPTDVFRGIRFKGVEFIVMTDVVECFHRLRSMRCIGLIVDCSHGEWSGLDVCGFVRGSTKLKNLSLIVYGIEPSQVDVTMSTIGADLCLPKGAAPHEVAQQLAQLFADHIPSF